MTIMNRNKPVDVELEEELFDDPDDQPQPGRSRLAIWLVALSLMGMMLPIFLISNTIQQEVVALSTEEANLAATLAVTPGPDPEQVLLEDNLSTIRRNTVVLESTWDRLVAQHIDWPQVMAALADYDPARIAPTGLTQVGTRLSLTGLALDEPSIFAYTQTLNASGIFQHVVMQTISRVTPETTEDGAASVTMSEFTLALELNTPDTTEEAPADES
jgi:hypothetical protein